MSVVVIRVDGTDITSKVLFADAQFQMSVNGMPGTASFRVRDDAHTLAFVTGKSLTLDIDGIRMWGGYLSHVANIYSMAVVNTTNANTVVREFRLSGFDYNILFERRFLFNVANPRKKIPNFPQGTFDSTAINSILANYLDLSSDGLSYNVVHVGTANPDMAGNLGAPGDTWFASMQVIARYTGAVYFINPDKVFNYIDSNAVNTSYYLTDQPNPADPFAVGYRDLQLTSDGSNLDNDALVWGAGQGSPLVNFKRVQDTTSEAFHGRWQVGEFDFNLYTDGALTNRATTMVYGSPQNKRGAKDDAVVWELSIFRPLFRAGDVTTIMAKSFDTTDSTGSPMDPPFDTDKMWPQQTAVPVRQVTITFPTPTKPMYRLMISHTIDLPWMGYEFWFPPLPPITPVKPNFPPIVQPSPGKVPGITDTFNRVNGVLGTADCGYDWSTAGSGVPVPIINTQRWYYAGANSPIAGGSFSTLVGNLPFSATGLSTNGRIEVIVNNLEPSNFWQLRWIPWIGAVQGSIDFQFGPGNVLDLVANDGSNSTFTVNAPFIYPAPPYSVFFGIDATHMWATVGSTTQQMDITVGHGIGQSGVNFSGQTKADTFQLVAAQSPGINGTFILDDLNIVGLSRSVDVANTGDICEEFTTGGTFFTVSRPYAPGIIRVFVNGLFQISGTDFIESDPLNGLITLTTAVTTSDVVVICYIVAGAVLV